MAVSMDAIKKLRAVTGAGVMDAKRALEDADGDMKKAQEWIAKKGLARAEKKADRETSQGTVYAYIHHDGKSGAMITLLCETDFVAKTGDFVGLAKELAMQVCSMKPETNDDFMAQDYLRDNSMTIEAYIKKVAAKLGENIRLGSFSIMSL